MRLLNDERIRSDGLRHAEHLVARGRLVPVPADEQCRRRDGSKNDDEQERLQREQLPGQGPPTRRHETSLARQPPDRKSPRTLRTQPRQATVTPRTVFPNP